MSRRAGIGGVQGGRPADLFRVLGLEPSAEVSDDDVRAAWRAAAAATHPDRADGGDPTAFAAAASAYAMLRTASARAEALADGPPRGDEQPPAVGYRGEPAEGTPAACPRALPGHLVIMATRIRRGRPGRLALRLIAAIAVAVLAVVAVGWQPASAAVITGALTWLTLTWRADLAASRPRDR